MPWARARRWIRSWARALGGRGRLHGRRRAKVAAEKGIDMPISQAVHAIVAGKLTVDAAIEGCCRAPSGPRPEGASVIGIVRAALLPATPLPGLP